MLVCPLSRHAATSFCSTQQCTVNPFCCDSCAGQACLKGHNHPSLKITFWDQIKSTIDKLLNEEIVIEGNNAAMESIVDQINAVIADLQAIREKYRQSMMTKIKSLKYRPQIANILNKIKDKTTSALTGDSMNRFMHYINNNDLYGDISEFQSTIKIENQELTRALDNIKENIVLYRDHKQQILKRSIIKADMLRKQRRLEESIYEYSAVLEADPSNSECQHRRASSYYLLNQYEEAIRCETEAIKLDADNFTYYNNRGLSYFCLRNYKQAINDFNEAIRLNPTSAILYRNRAESYRDSNEFDKALQDYAKAIELQPTNNMIFASQAQCYYRMKDYKRAVASLDEAIKLKPDDYASLRNRADNYYEMKMYDLAIKDYDRALQLNPNYSIAYNNRGNSEFCLKRYDKAAVDYSEAIKLQPGNPMYYNHRSRALRKLNRHDQSKKDHLTFQQLTKLKQQANFGRPHQF